MVDHSSTSNSDAASAAAAAPPGETVPTPRVKGGRADSDGNAFRAGFPWALCLAILIVIGFEVGLHVTHWPKKVPWDFGIDEYHAVAAEINRHGSAEIAILGSSRAREGLDVPTLSQILGKAAHRKVHVASYAVAGGRTYDFEAITNRLLRANPPPKMIIVGSGERDIGGDQGQFEQAPQFWNLADWNREFHRRGWVVVSDLPTVIRTDIGHWYWTLGYRDELRIRIRELVTRQPDEETQLNGGTTVWHRNNGDRTLVSKPVSLADVKFYARRQTKKPYPDVELLDAMNRMAAACQKAHVQLIVFQVPIYPLLQSNLSKPALRAYLDTMRTIADKYGARFIPATELGVSLSNGEFRDGSSHITGPGAVKVTSALGERFIAPALTGKPPTTQPKKKPATLPRAVKAKLNPAK